MVGALRPGGTVALLSSGYYRATFLPGYARLELLVRAASFLRWRLLPPDGPHHHDRHLAWLLAAGAVDTDVRVFPRIGHPDEPTVRAYLEGTVWPEMHRSATEHGGDVGLTDGRTCTRVYAGMSGTFFRSTATAGTAGRRRRCDLEEPRA